MKYVIKLLILLLTICIILPVSAGKTRRIIWTAVFSRGIPINTDISEIYCNRHTPSVITTTIDQITSTNGVMALNGITVRYLSYKEIQKDNLYFNNVEAIISGIDENGKSWSSPMKLYEQTLGSVDVTYTVWSTPHCKGTFLGTPTIVMKEVPRK